MCYETIVVFFEAHVVNPTDYTQLDFYCEHLSKRMI